MKNICLITGLFFPQLALAADEYGQSHWNLALIGQWLGGLVAVVALILVCLWALQRLGRWSAPAGGQIRMLGGMSLGGREKLVVVEVGETQLVLGISPGRVQTLCVLEEDKRLSPNSEPSFGEQLQRSLKTRGQSK